MDKQHSGDLTGVSGQRATVESGVERKSVRAGFVKAFGEKEAAAVEAAANEHANGVNSERKGDDPFKWALLICKGDDPFKWALLICIGYECCSKDDYRKYHGIIAPWAKIKAWIKKRGKLHSHVGDCDYLSMMSGAYNEFMPKKRKKAKPKERK